MSQIFCLSVRCTLLHPLSVSYRGLRTEVSRIRTWKCVCRAQQQPKQILPSCHPFLEIRGNTAYCAALAVFFTEWSRPRPADFGKGHFCSLRAVWRSNIHFPLSGSGMAFHRFTLMPVEDLMSSVICKRLSGAQNLPSTGTIFIHWRR